MKEKKIRISFLVSIITTILLCIIKVSRLYKDYKSKVKIIEAMKKEKEKLETANISPTTEKENEEKEETNVKTEKDEYLNEIIIDMTEMINKLLNSGE